MSVRRVLLVHGGRDGGRTRLLVAAAAEGVRELADAVELRVKPALQADADDLLWCEGLLLATPEHFGYMSGALKDFFERTYYPVQGRTEGLPYALLVTAGTDGTGTLASVARIVTGYRWKAIAAPLLVVGDADAVQLAQARELGQTLAAGLVEGLY